MPAALVADPWNGAGTTTAVAQAEGYRAWGGDANPAMVVVAKAKQVTSKQLVACKRAFETIVASDKVHTSALHPRDPLLNLLPLGAAIEIRGVEQRVRELSGEFDSFPEIPEEMRSDFALMYLALFRAARNLAKGRRTKNPTWHRSSGVEDLLVSVETARAEILSNWERLTLDVSQSDVVAGASMLNVSFSQAIPLKEGVVDLIVTSPPYCTRIDYVVATTLELAVLGLSDEDSDTLRRSLMGTTTVEKRVDEVDERWGASCCQFLDSVRAHPSKASSTYYLKSHIQYFKGLYTSLGECHRVLRQGGRVVLVVQDSEYKGIRNDLASITSEMIESFGFECVARSDFEKRVSMRSLNSASKIYSSGRPPIESVITFKK